MILVETLCAKCGQAYQTDLSTLSDKEGDGYVSERQRAVAAAGSHWRVCKDCQELAKAGDRIPLNLKLDRGPDDFYIVKHPSDMDALLRMPEPGELDDDIKPSPEFSSFKDFMEKNVPTKAQIGVWQGITFRRTD